ncbi:FAD dependent oxidoreductase [Lobosporangium transversale]|uniref:FAD dependent oxidoreductase n=1 Tax=Lobosporangium transversale TaxID=64571 RepID=A0A1Y2H2D0_9FUNG|nr:FAD dependent oxidoreductase [Lobosporangium transversale]ORZ28706.1 FAD dependent oxidoreductase [Lobosporangium transversale]|eukprot:XP_021886379.1 FAD dependent oxidoreductase [Lobosporangium transversale]
MPAHNKKQRPLVAVIGAGVVGLTTALLLQCNHYDVTIIASEFPKRGKAHPDYSSAKAGAHWRPVCDEDDARAQEHDTISYKAFKELAKYSDSGIKMQDAIDYYDFNPSGHGRQYPWWSRVVDGFKQIPSTNPDFPIAYTYKTAVITPSIYLHFLLQQFKKAGGHVQQRTLSHMMEAAHWVGTKAKPVKIIINCTGVRARYLGGAQDLQCFQTRGQTAVVRASWIHETVTWISKTGEIMYVIPRSNGEVVLGGSREAHQNNEAVSPTKTTHILKTIIRRYPKILMPGTSEAYAASPDILTKFDIVDQAVGFRPSRTGGVRVEVEHSRTGAGQYVLIGHNYGHGGAGFQSSWGTAYDLIKAIEKAEQEEVLQKQQYEIARL